MSNTNLILKNTGLSPKVWGGQRIDATGQYTIQESDRYRLINDSTFRTDLEQGIAVINDSTYDLFASTAISALALDYGSYQILAAGRDSSDSSALRSFLDNNITIRDSSTNIIGPYLYMDLFRLRREVYNDASNPLYNVDYKPVVDQLGNINVLKLGPLAITSDKIAPNAITTEKLDTTAVTSDKLATATVTSEKLASSSVGYSQLYLATNSGISSDGTNRLRVDATATADGVSIIGDSNGKLRTQLPLDINRCGFLNNTQTNISFDGTNTFTLADTGSGWSYYRAGYKYLISGNKTVQVASPMSDGTMYYIFIDSTNGTLSSSVSPWTLMDSKIPVSTIFWNNTLNPKFLMTDERHSCLIDRQTHRYEHLTVGTRLISGGVPSGFTLNSTTETNKVFGISTAYIADEDIFIYLSALVKPDGATPTYYNLYRTSTTSWVWALFDMPFKYAGTTAPYGYIEYDNNGTSTASANNRFVNTFLVLCNAVANNEASPGTSTTGLRYLIVQGRGSFTSAANAYAESFGSFNLTGFPVGEAVAVYQLTWNTSGVNNSVKGRCVLDRVAAITANIVTTSTISTQSHNLLTGLQGGALNDYYHITETKTVQIDTHLDSTSNPHSVTATQVGLGNVTNDAQLKIASNLSDLNNIVTARSNMRIDKRTAVVDSDYTVGSTDVYIGLTSNSAPRTFFLPAANSVSSGYEIEIADEGGGVNLTNTLTIQRSASDTIDGSTNVIIASPYGMRRLFSDGTSKWTFDGGVVRNNIGTAKGDLIGFSAANTPVRVPIGSNNTILIADSTQTAGVRWGLLGASSVFPQYRFFADQQDLPNNADWKVNARSPVASDSLNNALKVKLFDDTVEEGTGVIYETPSGATNVQIEMRSRAVSTPAGAVKVVPKLYFREISDNTSVTAWSSGYTMTPIDMTTNTYFQLDSQTIPLSTLGMTAGRITQVELTRNGADTTDTLVGDWALLHLNIFFS